MEYIKPELVFKKFYTESFLADSEAVSSADNNNPDWEGGIITDSFASSGADGWMNG